MTNCKRHFFVFVVVHLVVTILPRTEGHVAAFGGLQTSSVPFGGLQGQNSQFGSWGLQNIGPIYGNSMQRYNNMPPTGDNIWPSQSLYSRWGYGSRMQNTQYGDWQGQNINHNGGQGMQGYYTQPRGGNVWPGQNIYAHWGYGKNQNQNSVPYSGQNWNTNMPFQYPYWGQNSNGQFSGFNGGQYYPQYGGNSVFNNVPNGGQSRLGSDGSGTGQRFWNGNGNFKTGNNGNYRNTGNYGNTGNTGNYGNNYLPRSNRIVVVDDNTPTNNGGFSSRPRRAANIPCDFQPNQVYASLANSDLGAKDVVVIMAGTHSYPNTMNDIVNNYDYLNNLARKTNVIIATIPLTENDYLLNKNINITNEKIRQIPSGAPIKILDYRQKYAELKRLRLNLDRSGLCNWINAEVSGFLATPQDATMPSRRPVTWPTTTSTTTEEPTTEEPTTEEPTTEEPTTEEPTTVTEGDGWSMDYGGNDYGGDAETTTEADVYPDY